MKVLITAAQFSSNISGLQRHALNVIRCLLKQKDIDEVHAVFAPWQQTMVRSAGLHGMDRVTTHIAAMNSGVASRNLWYYNSFPQLAAQLRPDIVHLSYPVPVHATAIHCPLVLTLHDLYPYEIPENFGFPKVLFNRMILQQCLRSVDTIACVSGTTMQSLKRHVPPSVWNKSVCIHNCVEAELECAEQSPIPGWRGEPFLLTIAQHRRNKNIPLLIHVLHRLLQADRVSHEMKLVVIGIPGPETDRIQQLIAQLGFTERVVFLQGLPEASLQWCYRHCEALVAPSETEGFGLPVAEALLSGCRVVCSDLPAFHEIDSAHCTFVALGMGVEERFADAVATVMREERPAPISLPHLSSEKLGAEYVSAYRRLLQKDAAPLSEAHKGVICMSTASGDEPR